ncbi:hypothetical protein EBR57_08975 [bacterium]|nr:hypothetical protein [bacterium]
MGLKLFGRLRRKEKLWLSTITIRSVRIGDARTMMGGNTRRLVVTGEFVPTVGTIGFPVLTV